MVVRMRTVDRASVRGVLGSAAAAALMLTAACSLDVGTEPTPTQSALVAAHLDELVTVMQWNSLRRARIDWNVVRREVRSLGRGAETVMDAEPAIRFALDALGDYHSSYTSHTGHRIHAPSRGCSATPIVAPDRPADIGYVRIPPYLGPLTGEGVALAESLQESIRTQDSPELVGWIVDLRGNRGGNMGPMLVGIGPILGTGLAGVFVAPTAQRSTWSYQDGAMTMDGRLVMSIPLWGPGRARRAGERSRPGVRSRCRMAPRQLSRRRSAGAPRRRPLRPVNCPARRVPTAPAAAPRGGPP